VSPAERNDGAYVRSSSEAPVDVLVIGGGGAGLAAAAVAKEHCRNVQIVEAAQTIGGSTARSTGSVMAAGTSAQRALGIDDDSERFLDYYLTFNRWVCHPGIARRFCENAADTVAWMESLGACYPPAGLYRAARDQEPRSHRPKGGGRELIAVLGAACERLGVQIRLNSRAQELLLRNGRAYGALVEGNVIEARAIVLSSGGFAHNDELMRRFYPKFKETPGAFTLAPDTIVGDGLVMAEAIGANIVGYNRGVATTLPDIGLQRDGFPPGWLCYVGRDGKRFADETMHPVIGHLWEEQDGDVFNIFDQTTLSSLTMPESEKMQSAIWDPDRIMEGAETGRVFRATSLSELAAEAGICARNLEASVTRYNEHCRSGSDLDFLKDGGGMLPIVTPPFYAVPVMPRSMSLTTFGVEIDMDARVLTPVGEAVEGLYAAGEVVGNIIGAQYLGGGNSVGSSLIFGRIAGLHASELASRTV
jgi:fumarate reductase flavoprotein subunit